MAGPQIEAFALKHGLKGTSVADLIAYRQAREKIVERVRCFQVMGTSGPLTAYAYATPFDPVQHFAFVQGEIGDGRDIPARLHRVDIIADVIAGGESIRKTFASFQKAGRGVFIFLRDGAAGVPIQAARVERPEPRMQRYKEWRDIGLGAQILRDLGISSISLRTGAPMTYVGLSGFGIEISSMEGLD
jgi:3,4-dihydroxy 2-butanone 4-phosphate synthase/GTP cyclohydrolase II